MAGRGNCRGTAAACADDVRAGAAEEREVRREMPMCRHVHPVPSGIERQLCELQGLICRQNQILCELLQAVRERKG